MYTVAQSASKAGVSTDTVRHYVRIGILRPKRNPENGYKLFTHEDIHRLVFVKRAKSLGFTLNEITGIFDNARHDDTQCPQVRQIIQQRIKENRAKLDALNAMQERMEMALELWNGMLDVKPNNSSICHLIESVKI